jgi:hypothetical protein
MNKVLTIVTYLLLVVLVVLLAASSASLFLKQQKIASMLGNLNSMAINPVSASGKVVSAAGNTITINFAYTLPKNLPASLGQPVTPRENKNVQIVLQNNAKILLLDQSTSTASYKEIKIGDIKPDYSLYATVVPSLNGNLETNQVVVVANNSAGK